MIERRSFVSVYTLKTHEKKHCKHIKHVLLLFKSVQLTKKFDGYYA